MRNRFRLGRRDVPVGTFDAASGEWTEAWTGGANAGAANAGELTLTTFNVWFNEFHAAARHRAIADLLAREMPDVMVFQEVTQESLAVFLAQPWVRRHYRRAEVTGGDLGNYGMLLLSRLPVRRVTYTRLPTRLSRGFLVAEMTINGRTVVIASVHLESGKTAAGLRARQLRRMFRALPRAESTVVLGDFNMRDSEDGRWEPGYRDLWPALRPDEDGFTEDTTINLMRLDSKNKHRHVRFDRILLTGDGWAATDVDLLGTEPISAELPRVFPSDHFGVRCRLERRSAPGTKGQRRQGLWPGWRDFRN